jgi:hypothetical protein
LSRRDASVKSTLPTRFWSVGVVFAAFFGLLTVASEEKKESEEEKKKTTDFIVRPSTATKNSLTTDFMDYTD